MWLTLFESRRREYLLNFATKYLDLMADGNRGGIEVSAGVRSIMTSNFRTLINPDCCVTIASKRNYPSSTFQYVLLFTTIQHRDGDTG